MAKEDWSEAKAWMRATRERIGMTQRDDDEQGDEAGGDDGDAPTFDSRL